MARADTKTRLSLDRFAAVIGINPIHMNQIYLSGLPLMGDDSTARVCDVPINQFGWQSAQKTGREELAEAIGNAEAQIEDVLGFNVVPDWIVDEPVSAARPYNPEWFPSNVNNRGFAASIQANRGYIISGGKRAVTLVSAGAAIVYSDVDQDGYDETATVIVPTTVTDIEEIALFYPSKNGEETWQIRPLQSVDITAGIATIVCQRAQLTLENKYMGQFPTGLDGMDANNFLTTIDVYRLWNDPQVQVQLQWLPNLYDCCNSDSCVACAYAVQSGCMLVVDKRLGIVTLGAGNWNPLTNGFDFAYFNSCRAPDQVLLSYKSGYPTTGLGRMNQQLERAIAYFALSFLNYPLCECGPLEGFTKHWSEDLAHNISSGSGSSSFQISGVRRPGMIDCPFGTTRGAHFAWNAIQKLKIGGAVRIG